MASEDKVCLVTLYFNIGRECINAPPASSLHAIQMIYSLYIGIVDNIGIPHVRGVTKAMI